MDQKYYDIIKLGTSALSDAMDRLGIPGQALGIKPIDRIAQGANDLASGHMGMDSLPSLKILEVRCANFAHYRF